MLHRANGSDPGDCLICGAAHCSCGGGPIEVVQLPQRDAAAALEQGRLINGTSTIPGVPAGILGDPTVGDGSDARPFTTATYRGKKKKV